MACIAHHLWEESLKFDLVFTTQLSSYYVNEYARAKGDVVGTLWAGLWYLLGRGALLYLKRIEVTYCMNSEPLARVLTVERLEV